MGTKKSLMLADETVKFIENKNTKSDVSWSYEVNDAISRLSTIYNDIRPELSLRQWEIILGVYDGVKVKIESKVRIASDVMDSYDAVDISNIPKDAQETVRLLHNMSQSQQIAVLDVVERYWAEKGKVKIEDLIV